jgi:hypothetical protein
MKHINFSADLKLPLDVATQTLAFIARKRAGKSYAAGVLVEGMAENGVPFVIIDPVGNWYGLRLAADGKTAGLDVPVLGGLRGDIPLDPSAGKLVADAIIDTGRSFVLDVSQFSLADRKRFVTALGEQLWTRQKGLKDPQPIHVVLEEAQLFLPQAIFKGDEHMVGIWTEIVRLGGNKGIGVTLITQRPQSVSKEALTQVECLVVLQVNGVPEKKALKEWIVEKGLDTNLLEELPFLKQGVAYIWSPQWLEHFGKHNIGSKWTFDAGATPKVGVKRVQAELKPIDLEALRASMADTVKKLEENDPKALKRRVAELESQLRKGVAPTRTETKVERVEVPVLREKEMKLLEKHLALAAALADKLSQSNQVIVSEMNNLATVMKTSSARFDRYDMNVSVTGRLSSASPNLSNRPKLGPVVRSTLRRASPSSGTPAPDEGEARFPRGAREMLKALACRDATYETQAVLTKTQVATLAGISPTSGTFNTYLSSLRTAAYIGETRGGMFITARGLAFLGDDVPHTPTDTKELVNLWASKFSGKTKDMLWHLVNIHPNGLSKDQLGEEVGISSTSGTFNTYLSSLRSNGLVETIDGELRASDNLFL